MHHESSHQVSIDPQDTFRRFLKERKGGYCMNHNTLIINIIRGLGFKGFTTQARTFSPITLRYGSWTHQVPLVLLPNHLKPVYHSYYVVDVGYGALGLQRPLQLLNRHEERGRAIGLHRLIREKFVSSSFGQDDEEDQNLELDQESAKEVEESQLVWKMQSKDQGDQNWKTHYCFILTECFREYSNFFLFLLYEFESLWVLCN